jgi:hypothetical protein
LEGGVAPWFLQWFSPSDKTPNFTDVRRIFWEGLQRI